MLDVMPSGIHLVITIIIGGLIEASHMSNYIGGNANDYADRFICVLYSMTKGLIETTRDRDKVYEKTGIGGFSPKDKEAADALVQILADERRPPQLSRRNERNVGLTIDGLLYCQNRCNDMLLRLSLPTP